MGAATGFHKRRVLVVEDDQDLRDLVSYNLQAAGYDVRTAATGAQGLEQVETFSPDVLLLDLMLPDLSGLEICRRVRARSGAKQPVVMLVTAKADEIDRVVGFEIGADDYVVKPFSVRELLLRVQVQIRARDGRTLGSSGDTEPRRRFIIANLEIDPDSHHVRIGEVEMPVSAIEMRLLVYLATREGLVCSRRDLLTHVWNYSPGVTSRTVDTYVKRLRDKMGAASVLIQTIRGHGYRLATPIGAGPVHLTEMPPR